MANQLKKKAEPAAPKAEELQPEKEPVVTVQEIATDDRTRKIIGAICLLVCFFLFFAFTSYLFTWQEDQDKVQQFGIKIFNTTDVRVANLLGVLGAYTAHNMMTYGFGLAAYLFCTFFFVIGVNLLFGKKVFSLVRNIKYILVGLLVVSVTLSFFWRDSGFSWGGALGELIEQWLVKWIGKAGTGALLSFAAFSYIIWRFNPSFTLPRKKEKQMSAPVQPLAQEEEMIVTPVTSAQMQESEIPAFNTLKTNSKGITVMMPKAVKEPDDVHEFILTEKYAANEYENSGEEESEDVIIKPAEAFVQPQKKPEFIVNNSYASEAKPLTGSGFEVDGLPTFYQPAAKQNVPNNDIKKVFNAEPPSLEINDILDNETAEESIAASFEQLPLQTAKTEYDPALDLKDYKYPTLDLLETHGSEKIVHDAEELEANKTQIIETLKNYDIAIQRIAATVGPTVTLYEIVPAPGVRISRIKNLEDDIALSLAALGIRIIAPIPGKGTIGIEVPNVRKTVVSMKTLLASEKFQNNAFSLPIAIGKKIDNENFIVDLAAMPHLLMAGATGQGKSVGINALLVSLLWKKHPSQLKFVLVDPKKVELSLYRVIEKHFLAKLPGEEESIITDTKKVIYTLNALCIEMDNRYDLLKEAGCRNIKEYNEKFVRRRLNPQKGHQFLPFIVLVVDEFADLIMTAGKEVEMPIARLAQLARAVGIHLIIATQRPSVNIITGTIKANFPARIAFKVSSKIDSRTILDAGGAEQLIGKGDMLISYNGEITRLQCAFVDTPEVEKVAEFIGYQENFPEQYFLPEFEDEKELAGKDFDAGDRDLLFEDAAKLIVANQIGSTSLIQRKMKLGYNRAGRLMDQLEAAGIVGKNVGSKAREVLVKTDSELAEILDIMR